VDLSYAQPLNADYPFVFGNFQIIEKPLPSPGNRTFKVKIIAKGNSGVMLRGENEEIYF